MTVNISLPKLQIKNQKIQIVTFLGDLISTERGSSILTRQSKSHKILDKTCQILITRQSYINKREILPRLVPSRSSSFAHPLLQMNPLHPLPPLLHREVLHLHPLG